MLTAQEIFPSLPGFLLCAPEGYLHREPGSPPSLDKIPQPGTGRGGQGMTPESIPKPRAGTRSQMTTAFPNPGTHHPQVPRGLIKSPPAIQRANSCQGHYCFSSYKYGMATRSTFLGNTLFWQSRSRWPAPAVTDSAHQTLPPVRRNQLCLKQWKELNHKSSAATHRKKPAVLLQQRKNATA